MKKLISIVLSLLILSSSMGMTLSTHFCMGHAVDSELMIGEHELNCGMMDMDVKCELKGTNIMAPGCCENEFVSIDIDEDYQIVKTELTLETNFLFAIAYTLIYHHLNTEPLLAHTEHPPPLLEQDYQSLFQSFRL